MGKKVPFQMFLVFTCKNVSGRRMIGRMGGQYSNASCAYGKQNLLNSIFWFIARNSILF